VKVFGFSSTTLKLPEAFAGVDARLSRYSYLVSLLPQRIVEELGLEIGLARRRFSSYTPNPADPGGGLLVDNGDADATRASFDRIGAGADSDAWAAFYADTGRLALALFPTVCEPLPTRSEARLLLGDDSLWERFVEHPLGRTITEAFTNDLVRGVVATDGLIGTFTSAEAGDLAANRCFLYHVIGNGTGDWDVPIGGMGAVTGELEKAAREAGAYVVIGVNERSRRSAGELFNTNLVFSPDGLLLGWHRKLMPTHHERLFHGIGGGDDLAVIDTPIGRIGGLICWENFMPLARYALYRQGPQIWVAPTMDDGEAWLGLMSTIAFEATCLQTRQAKTRSPHCGSLTSPVTTCQPSRSSISALESWTSIPPMTRL